MYIKNNRVYDNGVSFEIPKDVRINIGANGEVSFFRDDQFWFLIVEVTMRPFGKGELEEFIADRCANNHVLSVRTYEKTINGVFMRQVCFDFGGKADESMCTYFLNVRMEQGLWMHCRVNGNIYRYGPDADRRIEDDPVINAFVGSVRKEPEEEWRELPACLLKIRRARRKELFGVEE